MKLGQILIDHAFVEEATLYDALARTCGLERFNLRTAILEKSALALLPAEQAFQQGIAPFKVDVGQRTLHVAVTDPTNPEAVDALSFRTGLKVKVFVASETEIQRVLRHHFYGDPLDRDPRNVQRPGAPMVGHVDIDESQIIHGMAEERDQLLGAAGQRSRPAPVQSRPDPRIAGASLRPGPPPAGPPGPPGPPAENGRAAVAALLAGMSEQDRAALARLKPIFDAQEEAARALRVIFELCIARGIIRREEYLDRLQRTPD